MKFIRSLLGRNDSARTTSEPLELTFEDKVAGMGHDDDRRVSEMLNSVSTRAQAAAPAPRAEAPAPKPAKAAPKNIWDMDDDKPSTSLPKIAPEPQPQTKSQIAEGAPVRSPGRSRRTKTRLIGFEHSDGAVVDLFNDSPKAAPAKSARFPVGWIVVQDGPGRGESFALQAGLSPIGRGDDQAVILDFGDNSISRSNHAAIVYDDKTHEFLLGHGGKSNIVRLNDKPLISNENIKTGDIITIGETKLRFIALCGGEFNWSGGKPGEEEDVAIA